MSGRLDEAGHPGAPHEAAVILHIVGARPQFIKVAAVLAAATTPARHRLIHTGEHYDADMSDVFFQDLGLPAPDVHLGVGGGQHGAVTGAMLSRLEALLLERTRGVVVVYGDNNSTLAGALAAAKLGWPIVHVEAGLRSYDRRMPEEINRVVTDHVSQALLCPTRRAVTQLEREGITQGVFNTGDVMLDLARQNATRAVSLTALGQFLSGDRLGPPPAPLDHPALRGGQLASDEGYILATIHRASNTDDPQRLAALISGLGRLGRPVIWPLHPRTRKAMTDNGITPPRSVICTSPQGYLEFAALLAGCVRCITDSGGVQKEAFFAGRPCVTLRDTTEWPETLHDGWNVLVADDLDALVRAAGMPTPNVLPNIEAYGDGQAARRCIDVMETYLPE